MKTGFKNITVCHESFVQKNGAHFDENFYPQISGILDKDP